jgi:L-ribulokinase
MLPKACELVVEDGEVYRAAARIVEAGDWIGWQLTGRLARNACAAGYKAGWCKAGGYPTAAFLAAVHSDLEDLYTAKLAGPVLGPGTLLGGLTRPWAERLGLTAGTPVAVPIVDAHAAVLGTGVADAGTVVMVMGTSACQMLLADREVSIPGIAGVVEDGILPGLFAYEAGQPAVGDLLTWFVETVAPRALHREAESRGLPVHALASRKAAALRPGESGLIALDWWNGNRSLLKDGELTGMILGMTLATRPEEIYRALVEGTAFGARMAIDAFTGHGLAVHTVVCTGGLASDACLLEIYADSLDRELLVAGSEQASAVGAAMLGATAAGPAAGGHASLRDAVLGMALPPRARILPQAGHRAACEALYRAYRDAHDHFGRGGTDLMRRLTELRRAARTP